MAMVSPGPVFGILVVAAVGETTPVDLVLDVLPVAAAPLVLVLALVLVGVFPDVLPVDLLVLPDELEPLVELLFPVELPELVLCVCVVVVVFLWVIFRYTQRPPKNNPRMTAIVTRSVRIARSHATPVRSRRSAL